MTESVEVRPRFMDNDLQESTAMPVESQTQAVATAAKGLFTSMYENKIIVLIIIVTIIVIAFVAYFVFKKEPEANTQQNTQQVYTQKQPPQKVAEQSSEKPVEEIAVKPTHTELVKKSNPDALKELLNRSKAASQPSVSDEIPITQSKTDAEIMALMEDDADDADDDEQKDNVVSEDDSNNTDTQNEAEQHESIELDFTKNESTCSAMSQSGRPCKNRVRDGGKCAKHSA